jgi:hypothetical protein
LHHSRCVTTIDAVDPPARALFSRYCCSDFVTKLPVLISCQTWDLLSRSMSAHHNF